MPKYAVVEKNVGETPLTALRAYRARHPELSHIPMTYAGRLDPMASGKLLLLIGEECKKKESYLGLDKEYEFEVLLGCSSDTGDVLGLIRDCAPIAPVSAAQAAAAAGHIRGTRSYPYPAYSSKTVNGKPLFQYQHEGLQPARHPTVRARVYQARYLDSRIITGEALFIAIADKLDALNLEGNTGTVGADFRREAVRERWRSVLNDNGSFQILRFVAIVSSGTYIRTLAPMITQQIGTSGLAYSIHRTKIGKYVPVLRGHGFWAKFYRGAH